MKKYYYYVYGEKVVSDFEIPELLAINPTDDVSVTIRLGKIDEDIIKTASAYKGFYYTPKYACFYIEAVGYFLTRNGNEIIVECNEDFNESSRRTFTLGSAFGLTLIYKHRIPIHGGTVVKGGKAILVTGDSGAGKSTITTALRLSGMDLLADDVSVLARDESGKWYVEPAYPQQKLCRDAAIKLGYDLNDLIYINEHRDKFAVRLKEGFEKERRPLNAIVKLSLAGDEQTVELETSEIKGVEKLIELRRNTYRGFIYDIIGMDANTKQNYLEIAGNVPIYKLSRKAEADTMDEIVNIITTLIN